MIKVLYVVAGDMSFDEMLFLDSFLNQLPPQAVTNHLLVPMLPLTHVTLQNRSLDFTVAKPGFGYEEFQQLLEDFDPQILILLDPYILLVPDGPDLSYIQLDWLEDLQPQIAVMDFRANLLKTPDGQLALADYVLAGETPPFVLDYDFLIKICPPHDAIPSNNPKLLQWGCHDQMSSLAIHSVRDEVRSQLGCTPDARLVTIVFPVENTLQALQKGIAGHFPVVIETLIHYLNQLEGQFVLSAINMPPPFEDFEFDNVKIRFFPTLDLDLLGNLLKATELFVTESLSYPGLIFSALRDIPGITLGSSVALEADGSLSHRAAELSPLLQLKLENLKEWEPEAIFPFISFPSRLRHAWPQTELFSQSFLYFLADLFDEQRMVSLIDGLLNKGPDHAYFCETTREYRQRKLEQTQDAEQIIRRLVTAPPRHLA
ncbi:MAG: hypothetical protein CVV27_11125 [Candidatus Melainabacteria bacterium HGW-Melainabacteria-1]|nr:MAG: hypothetical protein CVV27_11125 [Candidatus Melainabacteria bacterium HGW-Melainabacteria-1]